MQGEYNSLISTAMDSSNFYHKGRDACFDIGISGNCIGNCLLCRAFKDDFDNNIYKLDKNKETVLKDLQELINMDLIDLKKIKHDYIKMKGDKDC